MNFYKKYDVYDKNAIVQRKTAEKLLKLSKEYFDKRNFESVYEIGCGTGIFTRMFLKNFKAEKIILNDIFDVKKFLHDIDYTKFILKDMDREDFPRVSLILSSSVFQWSKNFEELVKNISKSCRYLVFSIYLEDNLPEIKKHFSISLNYMTAEEIENILKKYFKNIKKESEIFIENFNSPIEVLRHLKNTGVTGFEKTEIKKIRSFSSAELIYKVGYFLCEK